MSILYHNDRYGFVGGVNVDLPYWGDFEVRGTLRFNAVPVTLLGINDGSSGWLDLGLSLGYESWFNNFLKILSPTIVRLFIFSRIKCQSFFKENKILYFGSY